MTPCRHLLAATFSIPTEVPRSANWISTRRLWRYVVIIWVSGRFLCQIKRLLTSGAGGHISHVFRCCRMRKNAFQSSPTGERDMDVRQQLSIFWEIWKPQCKRMRCENQSLVGTAWIHLWRCCRQDWRLNQRTHPWRKDWRVWWVKLVAKVCAACVVYVCWERARCRCYECLVRASQQSLTLTRVS